MERLERILIVEDDDAMLASCQQALEEAGYHVLGAESPQEAEPWLLREGIDLVITDLRMPHGGGKEVIRLAHDIAPGLPVIVITAYPSVESAVEAFKSGVVDYVQKPFTGDQLLEVVERTLQTSRAHERAQLLRQMSAPEPGFPEILGASPRLKSMLIDVRRIAPLEGHVLIQGETGSGKELVAKAIHLFSRRNGGPFVVVNCAALPDTLLEAELFGFEKGAFTGAVGAKPGLLEQAHNGSLLLDEIAELAPASQAKLLRCLEEKACRRLGSVTSRPIDVRILAATHKDLREETRLGRWREDIYYRLSALEVRVPPLRERIEDIPQLAVAFLDQLNAQAAERRAEGFSEDALDLLISHSWPGNVRELQNAVQRAFARASGPVITSQDILESGPLKPTDEAGDRSSSTRGRAMEEFERQHLMAALSSHGGNVTHAAKALGVHRTTLQRLIRKYGIS